MIELIEIEYSWIILAIFSISEASDPDKFSEPGKKAFLIDMTTFLLPCGETFALSIKGESSPLNFHTVVSE